MTLKIVSTWSMGITNKFLTPKKWWKLFGVTNKERNKQRRKKVVHGSLESARLAR